jgi:aspartyl-tRNA(Asn)/glutamyl-tRNA(Gln) amidotransferase subunit C
MALTDDDVRHVAMLAQLALTDDEVAALAPQLGDILAYAETVGAVAADDVPRTSHAYPLANVFRDDDQVGTPLSPQQVVANAPQAQDEQFRVPPIMGTGA